MRRAAAALVVVVATLLAAAAPASAHTVSGTQPTDYESKVLSISPPVPGLSLRLLDLGRRVQLTNHTNADVVVLDANGAPDPAAGPGGVVKAGRTVRWRDPRTRWEGPDPPAVRAAPDKKQVVTQWTIPMRAGDVPTHATGTITWVPGPSAVPWLVAALVLFVATVALGWARRWGPCLAAALAILIAVDAVHSFASAAAAAESVAVTAGRVLGLGFLSTLAWVGGIWAIGRLQRSNELGVLLAALCGFVIGLYSLSDTVILGRSQIPYVFPAVAARAAVSVSLGAGFGLAAAAVVVFKRNPGLVTRASEA